MDSKNSLAAMMPTLSHAKIAGKTKKPFRGGSSARVNFTHHA
jgi:hypothetical protein